MFWIIGFGIFTYFGLDYLKGETVYIEGYLEDIESSGKSGNYVLSIGEEQLIYKGSKDRLQIGEYYMIEYWSSSTIVKNVTRKEELP